MLTNIFNFMIKKFSLFIFSLLSLLSSAQLIAQRVVTIGLDGFSAKGYKATINT